MQKTKPKRGLNRLTQGVIFAILWAVIVAIFSALLKSLTETPAFVNLTLLQITLILTLWPNIIRGWVQVQLIERLLKRSMRGWLIYTLAGSLITLVITNLLYTVPDWAARLPETIKLSVYLLPELLQFIWLWKHVKKAWLWPLFTVITYLGLNHLYMNSPWFAASPVLPMLVPLFNFIEGGIMYYLVTHPKNAEKTKVEFAADEQSEHERLQRLQEDESHGPLWDIGDDQTLQSEA